MPTWLLLVTAFGLVLINGFFIAAEFAIVKLRARPFDALDKPAGYRMKMTRHVFDHLNAYLAGIQFGIALATLSLGWIGGTAFARLFEPAIQRTDLWSSDVSHMVAVALAFCVILTFHVVLGGLTPKFLALSRPESAALWVSWLLVLFYRLFFPAIWVMSRLSNALLHLIRMPLVEMEETRAPDEMRLILAESQKTGPISNEEKALVENVFEMAERTARQIMVPRTDIVYLSTTDPMKRTLQIAHQFRYTRYPLCEGDLDHIVGMIHIKELFVIVQDGLKVNDLDAIKRDVLFVPETASVKSLLKAFQTRHVQMAIIIDEYGGTAGLVTLEDVLEEIVGDIQDELDKPAPPKFQRTGDGGYIVQANALLEEVRRELGIEVTDEENDTIGGHVITRLGRLAQPGDTIDIGPYEVRVRKVHGRRVNDLKFIPRPATVTQEDKTKEEKTQEAPE